MKRSVSFLQVFIVLLAVGAAAPASALTVRDAAGQEVEIQTPVKRAICLSLYELIPVFGVWDQVAAVNRWAYDSELLKGFARIGKIPSVGTADALNVEALLALHPDLVITWTYKPEVSKFLVEKGVRVISVYPESMEELYSVMDLFGSLFHKEARAAEVRASMEAAINGISARVAQIPAQKRRRVLWVWRKPTTVSGGVGLQNDVIGMVGAVNPAGEIKTKLPEVSMEWIVGWDPDVIFIWGSARYGAEDILSNSQWKAIRAVKEGRVYKAPAWSNWSPAIVSLALWTAWKTYPEYFDRRKTEEQVREFQKNCYGAPLEGAVFE